MFRRISQDAAVILLGLLAGAMLLIGVAFVGYWQSLDPDDFLKWFTVHANRIGDVMLPLGAAATLAAVVSAATSWNAGRAARAWSLASAVLAVVVVIVYFEAHAWRNAAFVVHAVPREHVAAERTAWARWHWVRVLLGLAAFWAQLRAVRSDSALGRKR